MTYYDVAFEEKQYRAIASRAAKYYQDSCDSSGLPLIQAPVADADEYRYTNLLDPFASTAGQSWSAGGLKAYAVHNYSDFDLFTQQCNLYFDMNERRRFGESMIADKRGAIIDKWAIDVEQACWHGPKNTGGLQIVEGLIGQLTDIENVDGTDSVLNVKGDIWKAINTMIDGIPFAIRKEGPPMLMFTDEYVIKEAFDPDRIYNDVVEGDFINRMFGIGGTPVDATRHISSWTVSNKILGEATDTKLDSIGGAKTTLDVLGTDSRIMLIVPDPRWVGRIVSRGFSRVGEDSDAIGTTTIMGWKGRSVFFNTDCAEMSEEINWA